MLARSGTLLVLAVAAAIGGTLTVGCDSRRDDTHVADAGPEPVDTQRVAEVVPNAETDAQVDAPGLSGAWQLSVETTSGTVGPAQLYLIRSAASGWLALLDGQKCDVTDDAEGIQLDGCVLYADAPPNRIEHNGPIYSSFVLKHAASERWSEQLTAKEQRTNEPAHGVLGRTQRSPELHQAYPWVPYLTARPKLPWDVFAVTFGRGIALDAEVIEQRLTVTAARGTTHSARWILSGLAAPDSKRVVTFDAQTTLDWQQLDADTLTFSLPAGAPDIAGNETSRELRVEVPLAATGTPVRGWDFDAATLPVFASWGGVQIVQSTRVCEGSCLQLGPNITACGEPGIAGQLDTRDASALRLRVRARLASAVYATLGLAIYLGEAQGMPLQPALEHTFVRETMTDVPPRDTEWIELELALNAAQQRADLPFELRAIYHCPSYLGASRTPAMHTESAVLIDHISVE